MAKKVTDKKAPVKKAAPKKEKPSIKLDAKKFYEFEVTKDTKHLKKGVISITGEMVEIFIKKGLGKVK
jgi:hypothetical protein